jgi:hypothetical protein
MLIPMGSSRAIRQYLKRKLKNAITFDVRESIPCTVIDFMISKNDFKKGKSKY